MTGGGCSGVLIVAVKNCMVCLLKHRELYDQLKLENISRKLYFLTFSVAEAVYVKYNLVGVYTTEAIPTSCVLETSASITTLTVKKRDISVSISSFLRGFAAVPPGANNERFRSLPLTFPTFVEESTT